MPAAPTVPVAGHCRLSGALGAEDAAPMVPDTLVNEGPLVEPPIPSERPKIKGSLPDDDDDDFSIDLEDNNDHPFENLDD